MRFSKYVAAALLLAALISSAQERPLLQKLPDDDRGLTTGPAVGDRIPAFESPDQHGKKQSFDSLKGANGLVLLFVRSADW